MADRGFDIESDHPVGVTLNIISVKEKSFVKVREFFKF